MNHGSPNVGSPKPIVKVECNKVEDGCICEEDTTDSPSKTSSAFLSSGSIYI
jgi:hypothetical protein